MQDEPVIVDASNETDGNTQAVDWAEVFRRLAVYFMSSFSMSDADASDAAQSVILRLLKAESGRDPDRPLLPWCYRIARNYGIDCHRRKKREPRFEPVVEDEIPETLQSDPQDQLSRSELRELVTGFIAGLPDSDREVAYLRYYEDMKFDEIASVTGMATGTVRYRAFMIRKRLRAFLTEVGWDE